MSKQNATIILLSLLYGSFAEAAPNDTRQQLDHFEKKIRPVLVKHCYRCHSAEAKKVRGGLLLDTKGAIRKGGDSGPAIVPGDLKKSLLLKALRYEELEMPPSKKLEPRIIADFEEWVRNGAIDPREAKSTVIQKTIDIEAGKKFWAFRSPENQDLSGINNHSWPLRRIDYFVLARQQQNGLTPAPAANRRTFIRRVTFDLTGLPPTPGEVEAFVNDPEPNAEEKLVERLLASPRYGERWARPWLDLARYAEDQAHIVGNNKSLFYPNAYLYREWVINAFNRDLPYNEFVRLQLAADLIEPKATSNLVALGFLGLGPKYYRRNALEVKADEWEDRVDVVSRGLLGLTVACARCHDHKYDPIPTTDYYSLAGIFASSKMHNRSLKNGKPSKKPVEAMHIVAEGSPTNLNVFLRGNVKNKGPLAPRRFLQVLSPESPRPFTGGSGRLELADAIVDRSNPLTARVIVNRIWGHHFGRALVGTPSNFGKLGERPSHPGLLDDLAVRFMDQGWSLKWLQREILLSATYRQASQADPESIRKDPDNQWLSRMSRRRLPVESWRDALLAVTGQLSTEMGSRSIDPRNPQQRQRTVYSYISRLDLNPMLALFDFPDPNAHAATRSRTTTPLQKMFVLNNPFMIKMAEALADRLQDLDGAAIEDRITSAHRLLYGRNPTEREVRLGMAFLNQGSDPRLQWQQYAHVLLAANEMLYLD